MARKVHGICCICGKESDLTFEHIPPRAAFNHFNLKLYDFWGYLTQNKTRYQSLQNGAGRYSLCASCNNRTGEWYGAAFAEFVSQGMQYYAYCFRCGVYCGGNHHDEIRANHSLWKSAGDHF